MSAKTVYVLHKNGAPNHYTALDFFLKKEGKKLAHREFSVVGSIYKSIVKLDVKLFKKQFVNLAFLIQLIFTSNKKIVLGIAPYDKKLLRLLPVLKNHRVFYHSSWTCWDGTFQPKSSKNSEAVMRGWRNFLERKAVHIFAVSKVTKEQLLAHYEITPEKISEVYHTLRSDFLTYENEERTSDCIYIGRLVQQKGIETLLDYFAKRTDKTLTIIGDGKLESHVKHYADAHANITFLGKITDTKILKTQLQRHRYLVLNSIKTQKWEELFGIVIIESMSQGVIPISSNHSGPKSIINDDLGFLFEEGKVHESLKAILDGPYDDDKAINALAASKFYSVENISQLWAPIAT